MKIRKRFLHLKKKLGQKGQTLVEFVLLLAVISSISYVFVSFMNRNLSKYWEYSVNLIITDKPGEKRVQLQ